MKKTNQNQRKLFSLATLILNRQLLFIIILFLLWSGNVKSQSNIVGVDPFTNALYIYNPASLTLQSSATITMAGFTVVSANSIAYNPANGLYYVVLKVTSRVHQVAVC